jgi:hypothetical protein
MQMFERKASRQIFGPKNNDAVSEKFSILHGEARRALHAYRVEKTRNVFGILTEKSLEEPRWRIM